MHEVELKRKQWKSIKKKERKNLIDSHWFPSVIGPEGKYFIVDHHHLGMALYIEGQEKIRLTVLKDLSWLNVDMFWRTLEFSQLVHPYNANGQRIKFSQIPKSIAKLQDDPFRSLAGILRQSGGYAKADIPFAEFLWADYLRQHFNKSEVEKITKPLVARAVKLAKTAEARYLPGWAAPTDTFNSL
jgi:hypothetical protein